MANDAEKKNIARLDFDVRDATSALDEINKKLGQISKDSEAYTKKISNNMNDAFSSYDYSKDIADLQKKMKKYEELTTSQQKNVSASLHKEINKRYTNMLEHNQKTTRQQQKSADTEKRINQQKNAKIEVDNNKHQNKLEEINARQLKSTKTMYDKISEYAKTYIIYQGFNELRKGITETIEEMVEVEYQMVQIERVLNESSLDIDNYRDKLIQLAYDYGNSFENVADITLRLAQAGFDSQESLALAEKTLLALNTAELDATQATEDMVAVMAQWGLMTGTASEQAESYGNIIDKINKVADNFPTTSEDILEALKKTSSAFNLAGATIDETIATIVAAETASQRGGRVIGTALSNIVQQLKAEGKINIMESLGIDVYKDSTKQEFNDIMDIFGQLSEKMQSLKDEGKESSVEMQNLLEVFTVFRRNIGASLLGEMAGEDSTYSQVLKTSIESVGYSLQENEKHMKTAKAAQAQFNATLMELKTAVWDNGVEDVFRSMLLLGNDAIKVITGLVNTFGSIPTAIGLVTLAFTTLNKNVRIANNVMVTGADGTKKMVRQYSDWIIKIKEVVKTIKMQNQTVELTVDGTQKVTTNIKGMASGLGSVAKQAVVATLKTIGLEAATLALNAALTMGLSVAITAVINLFDNLIHAEEKTIEKNKELVASSQENAAALKEEAERVRELYDEYRNLVRKENRTPEEEQKIYEIQENLNALLKDTGEKIELITTEINEQGKAVLKVNENYNEQLIKIKEIEKQKKQNEIDEKKTAVNIAKNNLSSISSFDTGLWKYLTDFNNETVQMALSQAQYDYSSLFEELFGSEEIENSVEKMKKGFIDIGTLLDDMTFDQQIKYLKEWKTVLAEAAADGKNVSKALGLVSDNLTSLEERQKTATSATDEYNQALEEMDQISKEIDLLKMFSDEKIKSAEDYINVINQINTMDFNVENVEEYRETLKNILEEQFPEFSNQSKLASGNLKYLDQVIGNHLTTLQGYAEKYAILRTAQDEYNKTGEMTISTLQNLINNDLLQYMTIQNGKLKITAQGMLDMAEATKVAAIESLKDAAAKDIEYLAIGDVDSMSNVAKGALAQFAQNEKKAGEDAAKATPQIYGMATAIDAAIKAGEGKLGEGVDLESFKTQANAIKNAYLELAKGIGNIDIKSAAYKPQQVNRTGTDSAEYQAQKAAEAAKKAEEEAYKARLKQFTDYMDEKERLEKRWVDKQKELGQLSNEDYMYITQQRIERYKKYLEEIKKATWMAEEDRLKLVKEYSEKIEDAQVDYIGYLEDQLKDEIKALEDANKEKIKLIEEEADARIAALDKVTEATDRARAKEDYENERKSILEEISYWEQRTGREAQEALKEAKKKLAELDAEWEDTQEDWSIEDQIKQIEEERDAEIAAIEAAQEAEIKAMQEVYDAKVKMFVETGEIIYEGSVIQAQSLYNAYKANFIDPISAELANLNKATTNAAAPTQQQQQQYETYTIKAGDTLSKIARSFGTTVDKIMAANPYITNKNRIYAGKTLQIPKFHEGGIVGGNQEAFALLKPHEVILKPEWADGINKLAKMAKANESPMMNSTVVEVKGDLVRIDAKINDKTDAEYLTRRIEKMLKDKFNIKK